MRSDFLSTDAFIREKELVRAFPTRLMFIPPPALSQKNKQASDWLGVWECSSFICDCVDVRRSRRCDLATFLARCSQRRGGARAGVARARPSLPRATASRKNEREERPRDREIAKKQL